MQKAQACCPLLQSKGGKEGRRACFQLPFLRKQTQGDDAGKQWLRHLAVSEKGACRCTWVLGFPWYRLRLSMFNKKRSLQGRSGLLSIHATI